MPGHLETVRSPCCPQLPAWALSPPGVTRALAWPAHAPPTSWAFPPENNRAEQVPASLTCPALGQRALGRGCDAGPCILPGMS